MNCMMIGIKNGKAGREPRIRRAEMRKIMIILDLMM